MVTAAVAVVTLGAGFAGGFYTQAQVTNDSRSQPTVTVTVPGPTVTVAGPTVTAPPAGSPGAAPAVNPLPSGVAGSPTPTTVRVLSASPDGGQGGTKSVLTGRGFPSNEVVRVSFIIKGDLGEDYKTRDLRDTMTDATGAFSVEVVIPSDLKYDANLNAYLRARTAATKTETVFDLIA
ncbi:hypothetical protein ACIOGZ_29295 [Kitasatospora sp. NPDC088160]|uniref:hypothetical protein n=1 Tax=Kitasatospora sp. NPDC088160 TaxID=3364072 RepID=UPI00380BE870